MPSIRRPAELHQAWRLAAVLLTWIVPLAAVRWTGWPLPAAMAGLLYLVPIHLVCEWWGAGWAAAALGLAEAHLVTLAGPDFRVAAAAVLLAGAGMLAMSHRHGVLAARLQGEVRRARAEAIRDELTGLLNWRSFKQTVQTQLRLFPGQPLSLLLVDLDHFKMYNDTYGHLAGDQVLVEVARLIARTLPRDALAFRYGGEEFAVIVPATGAGQATALAEVIRTGIAAAALPLGAPAAAGNLTVSVGVATFPLHANYPEQLIERADEALYQAKRSGRNRVAGAAAASHPQIRLVR